MDQHATLADDELWGAPAPTPPSEGEGRSSRARKWVAAVLSAAAIGVAAVVGANLASSSTQNLGAAGPAGGGGGPGGFGRGSAGTVAGVDGSTIKMTTQAGVTVSVVTSASTTFSASSAGAVSDVKVGDNVRVTGTTSGTTVTADQVTDSGTSPLADLPGDGGPGPGGPPVGAVPGGGAQGRAAQGGAPPAANGAAPPADGNRANGGPPASGVVKTVNGGSFTLSAADGTTLTVNTSSSTVVTLVKPSTLAALKAGDAIQVTGTTATDGTITATSVRSGAVAGAGR